MARKLVVQIEMMGDGIASSAGSATSFKSTRLPLDDGDYDGATYYFEIIAKNTDASSRTVTLETDSGTSKQTISVANGTTDWTRLRSSSFTPVSGPTTYRLKLDGTTADNDLVVLYGRIIIEQVAATKSRIPVIQFGSRQVNNSRDANGHSWGNTN